MAEKFINYSKFYKKIDAYLKDFYVTKKITEEINRGFSILNLNKTFPEGKLYQSIAQNIFNGFEICKIICNEMTEHQFKFVAFLDLISPVSNKYEELRGITKNIPCLKDVKKEIVIAYFLANKILEENINDGILKKIKSREGRLVKRVKVRLDDIINEVNKEPA